MAPKRADPIENPPAASSTEEEEEEATSSEEEEEASSDEEEEEEEEEAPKTQTPLTQKSLPSKKPEAVTPAAAVDESEESESDSGSESDSPTPVKPIATKPMEDNSNVKRPRLKPLASPVKASSAKRPSESEQEAKEAKRPKKKAGEEATKKKAGEEGTPTMTAEELKKTGEDPKKQLFQRLFSEDDEIALLKGMLDYYDKKGVDPCADMSAFYDFVKKSIHTDVSKAQMMDKIRRLKKKFENNAGKGKKGEDRTFSKAHDQKAFELSKRIWGKEGFTGKVESSVGKVESSAARSNAAKSNGKPKVNNKTSALMKPELVSSTEKKVEDKEPMEVDKKGFKRLGSLFDKSYGGVEEIVLNGLDMIGEEKRATLEEKWKKLQMAELELFLKRNELIKEHAELMLEFYKSEK